MNHLMMLVGLGVGSIFVFLWAQDFIRAYKKSPSLMHFLQSAKTLETVYFLLLILIPIRIVNTSSFGGVLSDESGLFLSLFSVIFAIGISLFWLWYVRSLDMFEKEPVGALLLTFLMSCITIWLVFPYHDLLELFGFVLNGEPWNDWWYCVVGIGLIEETVKIIPFLIMLRLSKEVNEPFDYIFYGAVSALGFAFIENIQYLKEGNLGSVLGRTLYASLAHMFFTSLITYAMAIAHYKKPRWKPFALPVMLVVAAIFHGFYDFWLINDTLNMAWVTTLFFLVSMQVWMTMKNNLVNLSPFYSNESLDWEKNMRYRIVNGLVTIFYLAYLGIFLLEGMVVANEFLVYAWTHNIYVFLFIALNFGAHEIIPGHVANLIFQSNPMRMLLPRFFAKRTKTGKELHVMKMLDYSSQPSIHSRLIEQQIPLKGKLGRRVIYNDDRDCYFFNLDEPWQINPEKSTSRLLLSNYSRVHRLADRALHEVRLFTMISEEGKRNGKIPINDARLLGIALVKGAK
ncbi:MAG: RsiW-degrading membrane proteinase PrsW (M82 family) [Flavobacteriales bacterium]|jgi:RsiW-degrading membrane proteinase PrsW (M82 family)